MEIINDKVYCRSCNRLTNHILLYEHKKEYSHFNVWHCVISCAGCDKISFAKVIKNINNDSQDVELFPEEPKVDRNHYIKFYTEIDDIPENIINLYQQIIKTYNQKHNIICALGLRTLIEAICNELNIKKGYKYDVNGNPLTNQGKKESIEGKIFGLYENKYIIWFHTLILQRIREIGNLATHELITPTSDELYSAIEIIELLLESVYKLKNHELLT